MSQIICDIRKDKHFMQKLSKLSYTERLRQMRTRILTECNRRKYKGKYKATLSEIRAMCIILERNL